MKFDSFLLPTEDCLPSKYPYEFAQFMIYHKFVVCNFYHARVFGVVVFVSHLYNPFGCTYIIHIHSCYIRAHTVQKCKDKCCRYYGLVI